MGIDHTDRAIAKRVSQAREDAGLSKTEFASKLGLSKQGYQPYEQCISPYSVQQLFTAARVLNRPVEHFLGLDTDLSPDEEQLLALYRAIEGKQDRNMMLAMMRAAVDQRS